MTALKFTTRLIRDLHENPNQWLARGDNPFDDTDLLDLGLRVKHMNVISYAQVGRCYKISANLAQHQTF